MNVLDENIIASQCEQLRAWRIPFRQIGQDVAAKGWTMSSDSEYERLREKFAAWLRSFRPHERRPDLPADLAHWLLLPLPPADRQRVQEAYVSVGDTASAEQLPTVLAIWDRVHAASFQPADFDEIFAMLDDPGLTPIIRAKLTGLLQTAVRRGQLPPEYRSRTLEVARKMLGMEHSLDRGMGIGLLFVLDAREDLGRIEALIDDPDGSVSQLARAAVEKWGNAERP